MKTIIKTIIWLIIVISLFYFLSVNLWLGINEDFPVEFKDKYTITSQCIISKKCGDELLRKQCPKCGEEDDRFICEEAYKRNCYKPYLTIEDAKVFVDTTPHLQLIKAQTEQIQCLKEKCISWEDYECK